MRNMYDRIKSDDVSAFVEFMATQADSQEKALFVDNVYRQWNARNELAGKR